MNFLKRPFVLALFFALPVLALAIIVAKMGFWWGPLITFYPGVDDKILNAVLRVLGSEAAVVNGLRNMLVVGFIFTSGLLFLLFYGITLLHHRNQKLEQQLDAVSSRLDQVEITDKQKVLPALRSILKMLEVIKPQGSQEFAGHLAQVMSLVGQIRRVAKPQIQVTAVDGEPVDDETDDVDLDEVLAQVQSLTEKCRELDSKCDGNAAAIGEIQETLEITGVNAEADEKRAEASKDAAAKPAVTSTPAAPAAP